MKVSVAKVPMEVRSDVKARGLYELRQIHELMMQVMTTNHLRAESIRAQIQTRINDSEDLIIALRQMTGDAEAQEMVGDFESLRQYSQKLMMSKESLSDLIKEDLQSFQPVEQEVFTLDDQREIVRVKPRRRTVVYDFLLSLAYTLGFCVFFAVIWTQYAKTH